MVAEDEMDFKASFPTHARNSFTENGISGTHVQSL